MMGKKSAVVISAILIFTVSLGSQFTPEEVAEHAFWEEFLQTARIADSKQFGGREAVTEPWRLTLEKDGVTRHGLWKNPSGRVKGYVEGWRFEIAAYQMDKLLGLNMVPPTVEVRFRGDRGSCQLWIYDTMSLKEKEEKNIPVPGGLTLVLWNRATYLQRAFDSLIANEDRHMGNILITKDWRIILIDHSRTFRATKRFTSALMYGEKGIGGAKPMSSLPRVFVERLKALDTENIAAATEGYLTESEIAAVLLRRDMILKEIDALIARHGEAQVLY